MDKQLALTKKGLYPSYTQVMDEVMGLTLRYRDRILNERVFRGVKWKK